MSTQKERKSLIDKYKDADRVAKKHGLYGGIMQFSIIMVAFSSKHVFLDHYKIAFPALICLSLYLLIKDFFTSLRIEKNMTRMILEGVELEKKHSSLDKFFHGLLQSFNFANVLMQRSLVNVLALCGLGYLIFQFIGTEMPDIKVSR